MNEKKKRKQMLKEARRGLKTISNSSKFWDTYTPGGGLSRRRIKKHPALAGIHKIGALYNDCGRDGLQAAARFKEKMRPTVLQNFEEARQKYDRGEMSEADFHQCANEVWWNNRR